MEKGRNGNRERSRTEKVRNKGNRKNIGYVLKNLIHGILWCILGFLIIRAIVGTKIAENSGDRWTDIKSLVCQIGINEIYTLIGATAFVLFGIVGIYDFAYTNGLQIFVLPAFIKHKEKSYLKQAEKMMELYYQRDRKFIEEYENERTDLILQAMGLDEKQFHRISYEIIKARTQTDKSIYDLKCKAEKPLFQKDYIVDQSSLESSKRIYDKVDYFINFYTAMYDEEICKSIGSIMSRYIVLSLGEKSNTINYIVVPKGSNFLLGLEVGKILHKPVISILNEERIFKDTFWDGVYDIKTEKNNIVVVHDVLVTGKRIYESIEKLPYDSYEIFGIFCLMRYNSTDFSSIEGFAKHNIGEHQINCLFDVDEEILQQVYEEKYEYKYG